MVGFIEDGEGFRFAFGEVKTSSEERHPPQVMSNRPGHMGHQIKRLACDLQVRFQLICWLQARIEGKLHQKAFDRSCARYFNSEQKSIALFGILVRDTQPDERDLSARGRELRRKLASPIECDLIALYLPWKMDQLMLSIYQGGNA